MDAARKTRLVESIKGLLDDEKKPVQHTAVRALSMFKETVEVSIPLLIETVIEGDKREKAHAIDNLIAIGEPAIDPVIEGLIGCEEDYDARLCGVHILSEIYHNDKSQEDSEHSCAHNQDDPHGLGRIVRRALVQVVREALEGDKEEQV